MYEQFTGQRRRRDQSINNPFIYSELWPASVLEKNLTHALAERCCVLVEAKFLRLWREKVQKFSHSLVPDLHPSRFEQFSCRCIEMA